MSNKNSLENKAKRRKKKPLKNKNKASFKSGLKYIKNSTLSIGSWLLNTTSKKIALIYFALIPLFAIIYFFIPTHFYHTTNKYEHYWVEEIKELEEMILAEIKEDFLEVHKSNEIKILENNLTFNIDSSSVYDLKINDKSITFGFTNRMYNEKIWFPFFYTTQIELESESLIGGEDESTKVINFISEGIDSLNNEIKLFSGVKAEFVQCSTCKVPLVEASNALHIDSETEDKLQSLIKANKGFPAKTAGSFFRMMYLSATTLTTLGLGDITPISNWARFLITLETILGIVFMGLFVNSLNNKEE